MVRPRVFMDFTVDHQPIGRVIFELYNDTAPKTAENFRALCTGEKGVSQGSDLPLYYKNSIIHRSIPNFMIQGGDFTKRNGMGGESIYGGQFADEDLTRPLDAEALLCMANKGPDTNGSQFFVTLRDCPHLNGKHVVFGKIIRGYADVVKKIAEVPVDAKDRPTVPVTISNCGELELRKPLKSVPPAKQENSKPTSLSESESELGSEKDHKRHKRRHRSRSPDDSDDAKKRKRKHKSKRKDTRQSRSPERAPAVVDAGEQKKETEEEYDARLEREENERIEAARKTELERLARLHEREMEKSFGGVRFKGRGKMKYVDPELHSSR